jgi:uncharacterized membrane protein
MRRNFLIITFTLCCSAFVLSCSKSNGGADGGNTGGGTGGTPGPLFTSVKAMMQTHCAIAGCHAGSSPQAGLNFTIDATIVQQKDRIKVRAVDQAGTAQQMPQPPNPPLSAADQKKITDWIGGGGALTN